LVGEEGSGDVWSPYGPVRVGLTTTLRTSKEVALLELLRYLEKRIEILEYRYSEVCVTLENDILPRAERLLSIIEKDTTDTVE
jgi:hypothetical protein